MVGVADPVGVGLIASLSHPGGNVTGTSSVAADIVGKQLELLKEIIPKHSRIAVLWNPANSVFQTLQLKEAEASARTSRVELQLLEARAPNEFDAAFAALGSEGARALLILTDPLFAIHTRELVELSANKRFAAITGVRTFADAGGAPGCIGRARKRPLNPDNPFPFMMNNALYGNNAGKQRSGRNLGAVTDVVVKLVYGCWNTRTITIPTSGLSARLLDMDPFVNRTDGRNSGCCAVFKPRALIMRTWFGSLCLKGRRPIMSKSATPSFCLARISRSPVPISF
jgi:hypothetical protein